MSGCIDFSPNYIAVVVFHLVMRNVFIFSILLKKLKKSFY